MRTTALLILLVVLVSTGEALQCNTMFGGTMKCRADDSVCMHHKSDEVESMGCSTQSLCEIEKASLGPEGSEDMFICCTEDLCN
uniref:Plethodontid modulating factor n=1 Tax=Plethodon shermani TaxID=263671 RepID=G3EPZ6_9SALA|nr:plethodontid modulating factor precursor [Plethodon shermani]